MMSKYKHLGSTVFMGLFGILILLIIPYQIATHTHVQIGPDFFPYVMGFVIVLFSIISIIKSLLEKKGVDNVEKENVAVSPNILKVILVAIAVLLWIILVPILGFIITTALVVGLHIIIVGVRNIYQIIFVPILTSLVLYYLFVVVLNVYI